MSKYGPTCDDLDALCSQPCCQGGSTLFRPPLLDEYQGLYDDFLRVAWAFLPENRATFKELLVYLEKNFKVQWSHREDTHW